MSSYNNDGQAAYVVFGGPRDAGDVNLGALDDPSAPADARGYSLDGYADPILAPTGDVDGDGNPDLALGWSFDYGQEGAGGIVWGNPAATAVNLNDPAQMREIKPPADAVPGDHVGAALANLGDLNGDGMADLAVGAPGTGGGGRLGRRGGVGAQREPRAARTRPCSRRTTPPAWDGAAARDGAGASLGAADLNGDGHAAAGGRRAGGQRGLRRRPADNARPGALAGRPRVLPAPRRRPERGRPLGQPGPDRRPGRRRAARRGHGQPQANLGRPAAGMAFALPALAAPTPTPTPLPIPSPGPTSSSTPTSPTAPANGGTPPTPQTPEHVSAPLVGPARAPQSRTGLLIRGDGVRVVVTNSPPRLEGQRHRPLPGRGPRRLGAELPPRHHVGQEAGHRPPGHVAHGPARLRPGY